MIPASRPGATDSPLSSTWLALASLIRLSNQTGTLLLLFPTLWSLFLASKGWPPYGLLFLFMFGAFVMRSAGVVMNDLADRSLDRNVRRTQDRPLAAGTLTPVQASIVLLAFLGIACSLLWFLNSLAIWLSPIALMLAGIYPFSKRYLHIPQIVLGIAFGWGVILAWAAIKNDLEVSTWLLFTATVCWAVSYDTIYAIQDMEDDRRIGVKSSAIFFGQYLWVGVGVSELIMVACLSVIGFVNQLTVSYFCALGLVTLIMGNQVLRLGRFVPPQQAFSMFQQHCWIGGVILFGIIFGVSQ